MPRQLPWGTPTRSSRMLQPREKWRPVAVSIVAGLAAAVIGVGLYLVGARSVASPGDLARSHHEIDAKCSQCHEEGQNVSSVRCARCHDQAVVGRVDHASHVLLGSGDLVKAAAAPSLECASCHTDHRGAQFTMRRVDDRECADCHREQFSAPLHLRPLTSFRNHPEFAAVKAQRTTGVGIIFNHVSHFAYVVREKRGGGDRVPIEDGRRAAADTCIRCHLKNEDRPNFEPIGFESGCAGSLCHTDNKGAINDGTRDVLLKYIVRDVAGAPAPAGEGDAETMLFSGVKHRDPWVTYNAAWIRASLDPAGTAADREATRGSVAWLTEQVERPLPFENLSLDNLAALERALAPTIGAAPASGDDDDVAALGAAAKEMQTILAALTGAGQPSPGAAPDAAGIAAARGTTGEDVNPAVLFETRRTELLQLVATVQARSAQSGDLLLKSRADDLKARIERLKPQPGATAALASLRQMLAGLDEVFKLGRQTADPELLADLQMLQGVRDYAATRGVSGVNLAEFEARRQELLRLLDTLVRSPNADIQQKAVALRARVQALQPSGDAARTRADRRRWTDRVRLEIALKDSPDGVTPAPRPVRETAAARLRLDQMRPVLQVLDAVAAAPRVPADERDAARQSLNGLLAPCLKCHLFEGEDERRAYPIGTPAADGALTRTAVDVLTRTGLRLAPVGAAEPVMARAVFTHKPHLSATTCATCHDGVIGMSRPVPEVANGVMRGSTLAADLNSPGVATCQKCHTSSGARQDCAACHIYHPPSAERLLRAVWSPN